MKALTDETLLPSEQALFDPRLNFESGPNIFVGPRPNLLHLFN